MSERHHIDEEARKARERRIKKGWTAYIVIGVCLAGLSFYAITKYIKTATIDAPKWNEIAKHQFPGPKRSSPIRGNIYSDEGTPLAISVPRYDARIDFQAGGFIDKRRGHSDSIFLADVDSFAMCLSSVLKDRSAAAYKRTLMNGYNTKNRATRLIDREITHTELSKIKQSKYLRNRGPNTTGFYTMKYIRRVRPYENLASRTVGGLMTDPDSMGITHGNSGLELRFDSLLCGKPGLDKFVRVPPKFERVPIFPAVDGMDVYTTINVDIQDITEQALRKEVEAHDAAWGTAIVMDVETGAIKALSNLDRSSSGHYYESTNHALADLIEPGSTFKTISMLAALETGRISPEDTVDVGNGVYHYARGLTIRDWNAHKGGYGKITRYEVIYNSSNVGTALSVLEAYGQDRRQEYLDQLNKMNVFDQIDFEIPGTAKPRFKQDVSSWSNATMPWSSFGYEVQMPPIYTLRFYNAIANNGKMVEPYLVTEVSSKNGKVAYSRKPRVINKHILSTKTLEIAHKMLRGVVTEGTAKGINSPYIAIAGKTGTALISGGGGYSGKANVTFCGYFPADNPKYSCIVTVGRPNVNSSGIPGRVLKEIAEKTVANKHMTPLNEVVADSLATFHQEVAAGNKDAVRLSAKLSGVTLGKIDKKSDWLKHVETEQGGFSATMPIEETMPALEGMATMDALYLAEHVGLKVKLLGCGGMVKHQNHNAGSRIHRGQEVVLTLK